MEKNAYLVTITFRAVPDDDLPPPGRRIAQVLKKAGNLKLRCVGINWPQGEEARGNFELGECGWEWRGAE